MTVQDLYDEINRAVWANDKAREHAIEAIKVLQEIKGTLINDHWHGTHEGAGCARIIQTWIDSLEAK